MSKYIRALHPNPERTDYNDNINKENLPGCGDTVLLEDEKTPPVKEGDVFRGQCPSCDHHNSRLETLEILSEE
jgi:hypothetical protein